MRYDSLISNYPDQGIGGPGWPYAPYEIFFPSRSTPGYDWKDITPRLGVAYDLFGNGKTAVKFNVGRYLEAITASNNDLDMNPLIRTATNTTRGCNDSVIRSVTHGAATSCRIAISTARRRTANAQRMDNQNLGQQVFVRSFDPDYVGGWGTRPTTGRLGLSVQHEVVPRVSVTVAYNRNWWGNWYVVDNRSTNFADYTPFSINAPLDPRLPNGGGYTIGGLYNLVPTKVGQVDELAQSSKNFGEQTENWQGVDFSVVARLQNGLTVQAGTSTGRRLADGCAVRAKLPELGTGPIPGPTGFATNSSVTANVNALGGGAYSLSREQPLLPHRGTLPHGLPRTRVVYRSRKWTCSWPATWASIPGDSLRADYIADQCVDRRRAAAARSAAHRGPQRR